MEGPTTSTFRMAIVSGTISASTPPSPGGNGRTPEVINAGASTTLTVYFTIEGTKMRTDAKQLSAELQPLVLSPQEPVNDYYLIANITEPQSNDVLIEGSVGYLTTGGSAN
jgi:hypothetical protein